jgi:hypothetical protein
MRRALIIAALCLCLQCVLTISSYAGADFEDVARWAEVVTHGPAPVPRIFDVTGFDAEQDKFYIYGGAGGSLNNDDLWALALRARDGRWEQLSTSGTGPGRLFILGASTFDQRHHRFVVCMWPTDSTTTIFSLSLDSRPTWTSVEMPGPSPRSRSEGIFVYDPERDAFVLFGGSRVGANLNDVWVLRLDDGPNWHQLEPTGPLPEGRWGAAGVYDPVRQQLVVCGGQDNRNGRPPYLLSDAWALPLDKAASWVRLADLPTPLFALGMVFDAGKDCLITFGGLSDASSYVDQSWILPLGGIATWSAVSARGKRPVGRAYPGVAFDERRDRMVLFGGNEDGTPVNDAWILNLRDREQPRLMQTSNGAPMASRSDEGPTNPMTSDDTKAFRAIADRLRGGILLAWNGDIPTVRLDVFDVRGARVWSFKSSGVIRSVHWDGRDDAGGPLPSGMYFARLASGAETRTARLVLIR